MGRPRSKNKIRTEKNFSYIITKHCEFKIDTKLLKKIKKYYWFSKFNKFTGTYYAYSHFKDNKKLILHRYILNQTDKNIKVDHKNGDTTDNTLENIRVATSRQNNQNARKRKNCKSKYKGVTLRPSGNWGVYISVNGKSLCGGTFKLEKDAALRYNYLSSKYFKEYARLNKIEE